MSPELTINPRLAQFAVQLAGRVLSWFAILQGSFIIFGGLDRWSSPSFAAALLLPGSPPSWGIILVILGLSALVGSHMARLRPVIFGMFGGAAWCAFFAMAFGVTAMQNSLASTTGVWAYGLIGTLYGLIGLTYRQSRKLRKSALHRDHS